MGFTPLAGLIMGSRSGDIDASIIPYIMEKYNQIKNKTIFLNNFTNTFHRLYKGFRCFTLILYQKHLLKTTKIDKLRLISQIILHLRDT